jgi:hypothetical protein
MPPTMQWSEVCPVSVVDKRDNFFSSVFTAIKTLLYPLSAYKSHTRWNNTVYRTSSLQFASADDENLRFTSNSDDNERVNHLELSDGSEGSTLR